jgi:uncharacterized protein
MDRVSVPAPTQVKARIATLDVIRGVAVLGILLMNITVFGMPIEASPDPTVYGGATGLNLWCWIVEAMFLEGTQRALFSMLFGASAILFTERMEASHVEGAGDLYFRRNLWLIGFGLVHGFLLLWIGDILFAYGVIALFIYGFRKAAPATLLWIALGGLAFNAAWSQLDLYNARSAHEQMQTAVAAQRAGEVLTKDQSAAIAAWDEVVKKYKPDAADLQRVINASLGSYSEQFLFQAPIRNQWQSFLIYRVFFDMFSMMLIGMALFKSGWLHAGRPTRIYWMMALAGYGIGLTVNFFEVRYLIESNFSVLAHLRTRLTYDVGRLAITVGHVAVLMLFCNYAILTGLKRRLSAVGQMAFTNYVSHTVICAFVFFGVGFGLFGHLQRYQLYYVVFAIWAFQLVVSPIWLSHYRYGPLEWLWRSLTYGKRQPMRRGSSAVVATAPLA